MPFCYKKVSKGKEKERKWATISKGKAQSYHHEYARCMHQGKVGVMKSGIDYV